VKVLLVGSGGREHALAVALAASPLCDDLHCAPGNPGIARLASCHPLRADDGEALLDLARGVEAGLVVIGPEAPLVAGLADALRHAGIPVFGPGAEAARLEGSKAFAKEVMAAAGVPTARYRLCRTLAEVDAALEEQPGAVVVKADGLAAGKGVTVCADRAEARAAAEQCLVSRAFGTSGDAVVIEEALSGPEVSLLALCDGTDVLPLTPAQDFKRLRDGDEGPNTGGMGAYSPLPWLGGDVVAETVERVHRPVLLELERRGIHFSGCLYAGLMLTADGPRVLEFNVRFGDPETQAIVPRLDGDLCAAMLACATGSGGAELAVSGDACVTLVLAAGGYPSAPRRGDPISGVDAAEAVDGVSVFHAGTARGEAGVLVTAGGRVLDVSATGPTLREARDRAYAAAALIEFDGKQLRGDIAQAAAREEEHARA
jgi:phosphoribosylamine--glycine ligase